MNINAAGLSLIKEFEGLRLVSYPDPATGKDPYTVGYGHAGADVHPNMTINQAMADDFLCRDIEHFEQGVTKLVTSTPNSNQFSALVCFAYNVGLTNLSKSLLLRAVNAHQWDSASVQFLKWNKAAGKVMAGLTRRRLAESNLFQTPCNP